MPLLDGRTVFYWLNYTLVFESKGEVNITLPIAFKIKVCGNEVLSRTIPIPSIYNGYTDEMVVRIPIRP